MYGWFVGVLLQAPKVHTYTKSRVALHNTQHIWLLVDAVVDVVVAVAVVVVVVVTVTIAILVVVVVVL